MVDMSTAIGPNRAGVRLRLLNGIAEHKPVHISLLEACTGNLMRTLEILS